MKLELAFLAGNESKKFLVDFTTQIDRLEKIMARTGQVEATTPATDEDEMGFGETEETEVGEEGFGTEETIDEETTPTDSWEDDIPAVPKAAAKKTAPTVKAAPVKAAAPVATPKAKKLTEKDLHTAAKNRMTRTNRAETMAFIKKTFKVASLSEVKPEQFEKAIKLLNGK